MVFFSWRKKFLPPSILCHWEKVFAFGSYVPRWESKYTININTEMNYWMADSCGLSECFEPYVKLVKKMVEKGRDTAASVYQCRGSVGHHNTDCYGNTDIEGLPASAYMWPMGQTCEGRF